MHVLDECVCFYTFFIEKKHFASSCGSRWGGGKALNYPAIKIFSATLNPKEKNIIFNA